MKSVWQESYDFNNNNLLKGDMEAEVVVVGAGIAGLLTAYLLKEKGVNAIIIDKDKVAYGNTLHTTAKITSQHDLIYDKLIKEYGEERALQYAKGNEKAIERYRDIIKKNNIQCDFEEKPAYIYATKRDKRINDEYDAAIKLGIDAELTTDIKLPVSAEIALKFNKQAQFNPIKFLSFIAKHMEIYINTKAVEIKDNKVITDKGVIKAKSIVIATHYPIINIPGFYFLKMHQSRSYVIALENAEKLEGMYIDVDKEGYSFRNYKNLLLLGALQYRTGEKTEKESYEELRKIGKKLYPNSKEVYHWSAQDCMTLDGIPYIGKYSKMMDNVYVITGFNKWGMTSSMVGAMIISDKITKSLNDFSDIFDPGRFDLTASIENAMKNTVEIAKNFTVEKLKIPTKDLDKINKGKGGIIEYNGHRVGVYKNEEGEAFIVDTRCAHLGCELQWNEDELTWDCPCHGSRFDYKGKVIDSPAIKEIKGE